MNDSPCSPGLDGVCGASCTLGMVSFKFADILRTMNESIRTGGPMACLDTGVPYYYDLRNSSRSYWCCEGLCSLVYTPDISISNQSPNVYHEVYIPESKKHKRRVAMQNIS